MNEKIRMENKKEDKKQFRKFIITLFVAFLVGIVMGERCTYGCDLF